MTLDDAVARSDLDATRPDNHETASVSGNLPPVDVAIIGAGPAGAVAAARLRKLGRSVTIIERQHFPRFSIGESLLAQSIGLMEEARLHDDVAAAGFQQKNGACFSIGDRLVPFDFSNKSTAGPSDVYQVPRAAFDKVLADGAAKAGADIHYGISVTAYAENNDGVTLTFANHKGETGSSLAARFVLDASGYGRVLPRLLDLDRPSDQPPRRAVFTHVRKPIDDPRFDMKKILITVHPDHDQVWLWLIPLGDDLFSVGIVGPDEEIAATGETPEARFHHWLGSAGLAGEWLAEATLEREVGENRGYSCNVSQLHGQRFALLGNAAEFLDPVFSSGVTIAMKSASLAAPLVDRQLAGDTVDWHVEYDEELMLGVETFRCFVNAWYDGLLQKLILSADRNEDITRHFISVLAGYAWDRQNPIVRNPKRFFDLMDALAVA
ncbi:MAG: FAD-dependent oxidoreductase [Gammaproteobacteria bacterium]|nr:MAG: FAD-dependent oxidoreductase [Gammaproteobacteria bacterium]